jgi:hypothetical protein
MSVHVSMYVCMLVSVYASYGRRSCACVTCGVYVYVCMRVCYVGISLCMYACVDVCMYAHIRTHI